MKSVFCPLGIFPDYLLILMSYYSSYSLPLNNLYQWDFNLRQIFPYAFCIQTWVLPFLLLLYCKMISSYFSSGSWSFLFLFLFIVVYFLFKLLFYLFCFPHVDAALSLGWVFPAFRLKNSATHCCFTLLASCCSLQSFLTDEINFPLMVFTLHEKIDSC